MLFTKDLTRLLLVPEGMEDTAYLPNTTDTVPVGAFSHSAQLTSVSVGESCDTYTTENGILYSKDKTTLVAAPAGYGSAVVIPEGVTSIASSAFAGLNIKSIVSLGAVTSIDPSTFSDTTKAEATVVLPGGPDYDSHKAVWEQAGFAHFVEPATPGDTKEPEQETSGFVYTLLDDYTLSVSWRGSGDPEPDLVIPSSAELGGTIYRVSTVAAHAFEGRSIRSVSVPSSITSIGDVAFKGCSSLGSIALTERIASIGSSAFESTALKELVLPASTTSIGDRAFADCGNLTRIVALSDIPSVASSAIEGCTNVSVITPYREDAAYTWTPGIFALGNHIEPYGIPTTDELLSLSQDETDALFASTEVFIPEGVSLIYAYPATCVSVDTQGKVTGKAQGSVEVVASLMLDDMELARGSRSVEVTVQPDTPCTPNIFEQKETPDMMSAPLPLTGSLLAMSGREVQPRAIASGTCGTCPWNISDTGVLTIGSGTLDPLHHVGYVPWYSHASDIKSVNIQPNVIADSAFKAMFYECTNLTAITGLTNLKTANVTYMNDMFYNCSSLTILDLSSLDTANVTNMNGMFRNCRSLTTLNLSNFNTANVTDMNNMFASCSSLTTLNLSNFNTAKVIGTNSMFASCSSLTTITGLTNLKTANVTNMDNMFNRCSSLTTLNLSNFDTANVTGTAGMFSSCSSLTTLNLSNFNTANVTNMSDMFRNLSNLSFVSLGALFSFTGNGSTSCVLPGPYKPDGTYTGKWQAVGAGTSDYPKGTVYSSPSEIPSNTKADYSRERTKYSVVFDVTGGTSAPAQQSITYNSPATKPASDPVRTGYTFAGWYTAASGGNTYNFSTAVTGNITLYAQWTPNRYAITLNGNGATSPGTASVTATYTSAMPAITKPTKTGYTFQGYYDAASGGTQYYTAAGASARNWDKTSAATLYARWTPSTYVVTLNGNGATSAGTASVIATYDSAMPSITKPAKTGYTFQGYFDAPSEGNQYYTASGASARNWDKASAATLYARWTANTYTIVFNANTGTGTMSNQTITYDQSTPLAPFAESTFKKEGYTFMGWSANSSATTATFTDKQSVLNLVASGETTLYAIWALGSFDVIFDLDGGTGVATPIQAPFGSLLSKPDPSPTKPGYTFDSWYKDANKSILWDFATDTVPAGEVTLYAAYTANSYSVAFDSNGGVGLPMAPQTFTFDAANKALTKNTYTKEGHTFAGWSKTPTGTVAYTDQEAVSNVTTGLSVALYAVWTENTYTIEFNPNIPAGSTLTGDTPSMQGVLYSQSTPLTANGYACTGCTFSHWTENLDGTGTRFEDQQSVLKLKGETQTGETITLYAQWVGSPYTVTYDKTFEDATEDVPGAMDPVTFYYKKWYSLPLEGFTRPGSQLIGWNKDKTEAEQGIAEFALGQSVKDLPADGGDAVTLYAVWTEPIAVTAPLNPTISIDAQGKPTAVDASFESNTSKPVEIVSATCNPVAGEQGTAAVFPQSQWGDIVVEFNSTGTKNRLPLNGSTLSPTGFTVPAKSGSTPGTLPVSVSLAFIDDVQITYKENQAYPVATLTFVFKMGQ